MEQEYSNNEIDLKFKNLTDNLEHFHNLQMKELVEIKGQTTLHNGRMKKLEAWRSFLVGGYIVVTTFVLPLLVYINFDQKTQLEYKIVDLKELIHDKH